jgi:hypothetical protein
MKQVAFGGIALALLSTGLLPTELNVTIALVLFGLLWYLARPKEVAVTKPTPFETSEIVGVTRALGIACGPSLSIEPEGK